MKLSKVYLFPVLFLFLKWYQLDSRQKAMFYWRRGIDLFLILNRHIFGRVVFYTGIFFAICPYHSECHKIVLGYLAQMWLFP